MTPEQKMQNFLSCSMLVENKMQIKWKENAKKKIKFKQNENKMQSHEAAKVP